MDPLRFWLSRKINYPLVPPEVIQVSLTYRCNLRCKMCSIAGLAPEEEELSTSQIFHIIDEANNYGIKALLLTGGEPFLREDIFKICGYSHHKGLTNIITTNGTIIDENTADDIAKAGINHIHLSLDGLEETHDFFRGKGAFRKTVNAIRILNEKRRHTHSFSIGAAFTVMDKNVAEMYEIIRLTENLGVDVINFQPLVNDNKNFLDKNFPAFWIKESNIVVLKEQIAKVRDYTSKRINIDEEPELELLLKYYKKELTRKDWICFGGFKTVFICFSKKEPLVYSCHGICGSLDKISLKGSWTSKEAYGLRIHSRDCKNLCMQSCYSKKSAQSIKNLLNKTS